MRAILAYHSIDRSGSVISVTPEAFRGHVRTLGERGVQMTTLGGLLALPPQADAVAITFDDGFANVAGEAWPALREHGAAATVFVVTDRVGRENAWARGPGPAVPILPLLDWDTLGRLQEAGAEIGSHTRTHPDLRTLPPSAVQDEVAESAAIIARRTGRRPASFAFPFGQAGPEADRSVRATYQRACTTRLAAVAARPDAHGLPRLDAFYFRSPDGLNGWGTPAFRGYLGLRAAARRLRAMMAPAIPVTG